MAEYKGEYDELHSYNRFENLDSLEWKVISHLICSTTKHANIFWRLLKYTDMEALLPSHEEVSQDERLKLVCLDNGYGNTKRVFLQAFTNDAWKDQCCSVYIYAGRVTPIDYGTASIDINIEILVDSNVTVIYSDAEVDNPKTNPNDLTVEHDDIVVSFKNRATFLLKCLLAELNGLYLDGVGYLQLNKQLDDKSFVEHNLFDNRNFSGHSFRMSCIMSGLSDNPNRGF